MRGIAGAFKAVRRDSPFLIVLANLGSMALALVTAPIVARAIGPAGRGETAAALASFAIVPIILSLGVQLEIRRRAAVGAGDQAVRTARLIWCVAFLPAAVLGLVLNETIFVGFDPAAKVLAFVGVLFAPVTMSWSTDVAVLVATGRYRSVMFIRLAQPLLYFAVATCLWLFDALSVAGVLAINIGGAVFTAVVSALCVRIGMRGARAPLGDLMRQGFRFSGSAIAEAASNRLDQILVLPLVGSFQAGLYAVAVTIGSLPLAVGQALGASYLREVAKLDERHLILSATQRGVREVSSLVFVGSAALAAVSPFIVPFLFGSQFEGAVVPTIIVLAGSLGLSIGYASSMMLAAQGHGGRMSFAQAIALVVGMVLLFILAPLWGAIGAAAASSLSYLVLLAILLRGLRVGPGHLLPTPTGVRNGIRGLFH